MCNKLKVICATTENKITVKTVNENDLGKCVGGYWKMVAPMTIPKPFMFLCNEEGLLEGLDMNPTGCILYNGHIVGDIVILKETFVSGEGFELTSLSDEDVQTILDFLILNGLDKKLISYED